LAAIFPVVEEEKLLDLGKGSTMMDNQLYQYFNCSS